MEPTPNIEWRPARGRRLAAIPAVMVLACLASLWGLFALTPNYWARTSSDLAEYFPLVVGMRDTTTFAEARALAGALTGRPEVQSARVVTAREALEGAAPDIADWTREMLSTDVPYIPPSIRIVVKRGVTDLAARERVRRFLDADPHVSLVWPDGEDLRLIRAGLQEKSSTAKRARRFALVALLIAWLGFVWVEARGGLPSAGPRAIQGATWRRGAMTAIGGALLATVILGALAAPLRLGVGWFAAAGQGALFCLIAGFVAYAVAAARAPRGARPSASSVGGHVSTRV
jgi:hypothetical protein